MNAVIPIRETKSTCPYCGVGCGVVIQTAGETIVGVKGDADHPANFGRLCSKGSTLHLTAKPGLQSVRARYPEVSPTRAAARQRVSWAQALDHVADRFAHIIKSHGPDAVAFYISGQLLTEDYYVFNKLAKGLIGTNNVDTNSRLCMSSAVAGYKQTLGADAPPCSYEDIELADCVLITGSNMAYAHPVLYRRLETARATRPEMKVIVVDPRRTETAREADLHLQVLPGTDVALHHALLHVLIWEGLIKPDYIAAHTEGFKGLRSLVLEYSPAQAAAICGVSADDIIKAARWFGEAEAALSLYCQGLNQSTCGTAKNATLINLHLATGHIGKPGAGPFSLTGQPNAMGGREVGGLANLLPAHRDLANPAHRAEVAALWNVTEVPETPGKTAVEMFQAIERGEIKALWIACTNPTQSLPDQAQVRRALEIAECVVLQEAYADTECARYADVLLPATTWGEKDGTVTNSERRITRVRPAVPAVGEARHDWQIVTDFASRLSQRLGDARPASFAFNTPESVWNEHRESTRGRDLDITGLSYAMLESAPQQWPLPTGARHGKARLYQDGIYPTANGKAKFVATPYQPVAESVDARYPFCLNTGRLRDQWHTLSRTGTLAQLWSHAPEPRLAMNPADLARRGFVAGGLVKVASRRGHCYVIVEASDDMRAGQVYLPMHWGERFLTGRDTFGVNTLTQPLFDPVSKQPELKHSAVRIEPAKLPNRLTAFGFVTHGHASAAELLDELLPIARGASFGQITLVGREREGVLLRLAGDQPFTREVLSAVDSAFGMTSFNAVCYDDAGRHVGRRVRVVDDRIEAVRLSGELADLAAEPWLKAWLLGGESVAPVRRLLLVPSAAAPQGFTDRGQVVCSCWDVTDRAIARCASQASGDGAQRLAAVQHQLKCGTNCGSCVPELKRQINDLMATPARLAAAAALL